MKRADRREWAVLGLVALGWALVVSPLLHREAHEHGHAHRHGPAQSVPGEGHGAGNLDHGLLALNVVAPPPVLQSVFASWSVVVVAAPLAPRVVAIRSVAQAQAPPQS